MKNWKNTLLPPNTSIREAIRVIDQSSLKVALVVDERNRLIGIVTDGDIRRGILKGCSLENEVQEIMNASPCVAGKNDSRDKILSMMRQKEIYHVPLVDDNGLLLGLEVIDTILTPAPRDNRIILMAGGLGSRLKHLTANTPKPMLKVGGKPILEIILENFIEHGFNKFSISVKYKSHLIEKYFGDGSRWNVQIDYLREDKRLGTAGALSLVSEKPSEPILVMNGDVLSKVNFHQLLSFHTEHKAAATMCVREYNYQVPFGVAKLDQHRLISIEEKPIHRFFVNAGIYVLEPEVLEMIPRGTQLDMPTLFESLIRKQMETAVFPVREYWLDIGRIDDFQRANDEYNEVFS